LKLVWRNVEVGRLTLIVSRQRRDVIQRIIDLLESGKLKLNDVLNVAQYDLTSRPKISYFRELHGSFNRLAKQLRMRNLRRETSSTYLFSTLVYYVLKSEASLHGAWFVIEPRISDQTMLQPIPFDYAILGRDVNSAGRVLVLSEV